eukprot:TRINITY_DN1819_c0_g1_i1.p3 TRINITY_DN1819_c0_g1~~TRINITY_DN1819_c0_g1_i1.p3  ORF type:complete len:73 (-),score=7.04 TRINITY_DN1819_c0_g1_i1:390-608(-)
MFSCRICDWDACQNCFNLKSNTDFVAGEHVQARHPGGNWIWGVVCETGLNPKIRPDEWTFPMSFPRSSPGKL